MTHDAALFIDHLIYWNRVKIEDYMVFQGGFTVFDGFWLVSMVFQGGFMVFHGFWLVSMVFQGGFMVFHGFWLVSIVLLVENTTKLYPGPMIQSRPCRP